MEMIQRILTTIWRIFYGKYFVGDKHTPLNHHMRKNHWFDSSTLLLDNFSDWLGYIITNSSTAFSWLSLHFWCCMPCACTNLHPSRPSVVDARLICSQNQSALCEHGVLSPPFVLCTFFREKEAQMRLRAIFRTSTSFEFAYAVKNQTDKKMYS